MRYIQGSTYFGIYCKSSPTKIVGFSDLDWAGDVDDQKSTFGCLLSSFWSNFLVLQEENFYSIIIKRLSIEEQSWLVRKFFGFDS